MADQAKQLLAQGIILQPALGMRELCRRSFWRFLRHFWPAVSSDEFRPNWHIEYLCGELQFLAERVAMKAPRKHDLVVNVPPGTTKTITCSVMFPVWCWTRWHWMRFITASYSSIPSLESADRSRDLMRSEMFRHMYPEISIKRDKEGKSNYRVVKSEGAKAILGGGRLSTSVGGSVTGFHGHILIMDDPLNPLRRRSHRHPFLQHEHGHQLSRVAVLLPRPARGMNREGMTIEDFVDELLDSPDLSEEIEEKGTKYQQYTIRARRVLQQKYKVLENILAVKQKIPILCLPGNYDMDLKYTALHKRDLHLHQHDVRGLTIAGYGGAEIWTPGVPERYVVHYRGDVSAEHHQNEMFNFFKAIKPDVIVAHRPAHGIHDRVTQFGTSGSSALRNY